MAVAAEAALAYARPLENAAAAQVKAGVLSLTGNLNQ
jgi:hypothetical protein